jgi:signal transduction histidine kinase
VRPVRRQYLPFMTRRDLLRDAALPAAIAVLGALELAGLRPSGWGYGIALEVAACALLALRKRHTLLVCSAAAAANLAIPWVGPQLDEPATPILIGGLAAFSLARHVPSLRGLAGMAVMAAMLLADYSLVDLREHGISDLVFVTALLLPPYVFGRITRRLADQKRLLEANHELVKREAVRAERDRIARELHDVIAHSVSAMVVQTAAAQDLVRSDPDRAEAVLADVASTGRHALSETGRLLHVIRDEADELGLAPTPGLADLPALVDRFRASGLDVSVQVDEPLPVLPAGVDVSAYRIVQEALTNALKYAADRTAALRLGRTAGGLSIRASNVANGAGGQGSGLGLLGIGERVSLLGGSLSHGVDGDGRFELTAVLPVAR